MTRIYTNGRSVHQDGMQPRNTFTSMNRTFNTAFYSTVANFSNEGRSLERKKSLNHYARKRDRDRIAQENKKLVNKLQNKRSCYDIKAWQREEEERQKVVQLRKQVHPSKIKINDTFYQQKQKQR